MARMAETPEGRVMTKWILDQAATVIWMPVAELAPSQISGGQNRMFSELRNAVLFVMEELPPDDRGVAMIQTDQGMVSINDIEKLYRQISS
jgi:hypothetical protein